MRFKKDFEVYFYELGIHDTKDKLKSYESCYYYRQTQAMYEMFLQNIDLGVDLVELKTKVEILQKELDFNARSF